MLSNSHTLVIVFFITSTKLSPVQVGTQSVVGEV